MKAHPIALRSQIITAYKNREGSMLKLACKYGVSRSFVQKIIKQERETGSVKPISRENRGSKLLVHASLIKELLIEQPNCTLKELCDSVERKTDIRVCQSTMSRFIRKIQSSREKSAQLSETSKSQQATTPCYVP